MRKHNNASFAAFEFRDGALMSHYDTFLGCLVGERRIDFAKGTTFVFVQEGTAYLNDYIPIKAGGYGAFTSGYLAGASDTKAVWFTHLKYTGLPQIGMQIEARGRLRYLDGCTDTCLIPPVRRGDPCLNLLHFPPNTKQTAHTHPSIRIGLVVRGYGVCRTPFGDCPLEPGMLFAIYPETGMRSEGVDKQLHTAGLHSFETDTREMLIVAYHPDSEFGATDEDHPMRNATYVGGISQRGRV